MKDHGPRTAPTPNLKDHNTMRHYPITAGNNDVLKRIKVAFNGKVYQQALAKMNDPKGGVEKVRKLGI